MKKYKFVVLLFVLLAAITVSTFTVLGAGSERTVLDPKPLEDFRMIKDEHAPALLSIATLYAPMDNKDQWIKMVCVGMTAGGCDYFKSNQADAIWQSQARHDGSSVGGNISDVTVINDTAQVWKAQLTIFSNSEEVTTDIFILVERDADGWYLNRVLYGPGITQEEL